MTFDYPKFRKNLICKKLGDEAMLYDPASENVHVLNVTSLFIWNLLDGQHSPEQIEKKMRENFEIPVTTNVQEDVVKTLEDFKSKGLLE